MPKSNSKNTKSAQHCATTKYRRQRTLVKKMLELTKMNDVMFNLIIYDPKKNEA